jgi:salicylate hydroxylase
MHDILLVGGGLGGLATALALGQAGVTTQLHEQSPAFTEVGAGIGLGPNAVRRLQSWGVWEALQAKGFVPSQLEVMDAKNGRQLGCLPMSKAFEQRYGAPYLTIHRADLHGILLNALQSKGSCDLRLNTHWTDIHNSLLVEQNSALIGADGINSTVRSQVWGAQPLQSSGHWAYRTLLPRNVLPAAWRSDAMGLWLHYPVRGGEWLNLVVLVESNDTPTEAAWDTQRSTEQTSHDLQLALQGTCSGLQDLVGMAEHWRAWALFDRPPLRSASDMAKGRVALLGDAAHPMLPYLAQGAGMAIEDAQVLAQCWSQAGLSVEQRLQAYAQSRWQRVAKVQARARRNARLFHASGVLAWGRDTAMRVGGAAVMDMPWLYGG